MKPVYVFDGPDEILSLPQNGEGANRAPVFEAAFNAVDPWLGAWAQFGVYTGNTANRFILPALPKHQRLYLFDSFCGLPEDWEKGASVEPKGKYSCVVPSFIDSRVEIVRGLYADTVPHYDGVPFGFIDIDCDLYSSTREVLFGLDDYIFPGTVIRFDEVFSYPNWREGEYRAIQEWLTEFGRQIEWLSRGAIYWAACRVTV